MKYFIFNSKFNFCLLLKKLSYFLSEYKRVMHFFLSLSWNFYFSDYCHYLIGISFYRMRKMLLRLYHLFGLVFYLLDILIYFLFLFITIFLIRHFNNGKQKRVPEKIIKDKLNRLSVLFTFIFRSKWSSCTDSSHISTYARICGGIGNRGGNSIWECGRCFWLSPLDSPFFSLCAHYSSFYSWDLCCY